MKLDELVNKHYGQLNENDLYIWNYIFSHRKECEKLTIDQLAFKCSVSRTTVLRFAQKLSLKGYGELKVFLKLDNQEAKENIGHVDMVCESYRRVIDSMKEKDCMILSILVDTFFSSISLTMRPVPNPHNTACVLS